MQTQAKMGKGALMNESEQSKNLKNISAALENFAKQQTDSSKNLMRARKNSQNLRAANFSQNITLTEPAEKLQSTLKGENLYS
jgi:hypothetical protein